MTTKTNDEGLIDTLTDLQITVVETRSAYRLTYKSAEKLASMVRQHDSKPPTNATTR